ncbi:PEGA domain-containing protein [Salinibacter ruber]|uniref:PEGA domain-containing protein n=1 Tax=Salinibacter ruber TaxID=146919 RepID=UPI0020737DC5|nr:PEGA domain-containing protein [Salinibacter ruber]
MTLGEETSVEQGQIRVQGTDGQSVTAQLTEGKGIEEGQDVRFGTVREVGTLTVRVQPEDATVYVLRQEEEARRLGEGTVRQTMDTGPYRLRASADGYSGEEQTVLVERGESRDVTFDLSRSLGRLTVETTPNSAQLEIETDPFQYEQIGRTPVRGFEYEVGTYDLRISREGYQTISEKVTLKPGALTEKVYELERATGTLVVDSDPSGASVYVDGNYEGTTQERVEVAAGRHEVELREKGYQSESGYKRVSAGETENVYLELDQTVTADASSSSSNGEEQPSTTENPPRITSAELLGITLWSGVGAGINSTGDGGTEAIAIGAGITGGMALFYYIFDDH